MAFTFRETQLVKGMLLRGDKQHDIAAYFGVNGGRVAEVAAGKGDYPSASVAPSAMLPPPGPYVGLRSKQEIIDILQDSLDLVRAAGTPSQECTIAIEALATAIAKLK